MSNPRWSPALGKLGLLAASLLLPLIAAEIALRALSYDPLSALKDGRELFLRPSPYPDVKYELTPGASGRAWGTQIEINARGYRGHPGEPGKFRGYRIIVLGDSIAFGNYLPVELTFPHQLEQRLNEHHLEYEVLNFAVGGYDTLQEVALLEHRGLDYLPDLVIVGYCINDIGVVSPNLDYIERVQRYQSNPLFWFRLAQFVASRVDGIRVGNWVQEANRPEVLKREFEGRIAPIGPDEHDLRSLMHSAPDIYPSSWYRNEESVGRLRYAFQRLATLAGRKNFSVTLAIIPMLVGRGDSYPHATAHQIVTLEAARAGLDTVDLTPSFLAAGMESLRIADGDLIHPNRAGHWLIAESLSTRIRTLRGDPGAADRRRADPGE